MSEAKVANDDSISSLIDVRNELLKPLLKISVKDLNLPNKAVVLDSKTDPKKAIEILLKNKVRAAPVMENNKFIGVLDLRDTVKFALQSYKKSQDNGSTNNNNNDDSNANKNKALQWLAMSPQITTQSLKYLSRMRQFKTVYNNESLKDLMILLAKGAHIVGVINKADNKLVTILTQGQLFQQIYKVWGKSVKANIQLSKLQKYKYITSPVKCIKNTSKAYDAFETMSQLNLSGLAVINDEGKIIHNTSATDIKLWLIASNTLDETIEQFLISIRKLSLTEKYPITVCNLSDTFGRGMAKLQATKYHRLWIVDTNGKPVGVLALTDIFKFLVLPTKAEIDATPINNNNINNNDDSKQNNNESNNDANANTNAN